VEQFRENHLKIILTIPLSLFQKNVFSSNTVYVEPVTNERIHPNCFPDAIPVNYYADIYALAEEPDNPLKEGVFSFEYSIRIPQCPMC
jgi:hypothetical protein